MGSQVSPVIFLVSVYALVAYTSGVEYQPVELPVIQHLNSPVIKEQIHGVYVYEQFSLLVHEFDIAGLWKSYDLYREPLMDKKICRESDILSQFCKEHERGRRELIRNFTSIWKELQHTIGNFHRERLTSTDEDIPTLAIYLIGTLGDDEKLWNLFIDHVTHFGNAISVDSRRPLLVMRHQSIFSTSTSDLFQSSLKTLRNTNSKDGLETATELAEMLTAEKRTRLAEFARRVTSGISDCKTRQIPFQNWDWQPFKISLDTLEKRYSQEDLTLTIPPEKVENYSQLRLADCFFSQSTMRILIQLPVRRTHVNWNLHRVISLPLRSGGKTCHVTELELGENIVGEANGRYAVLTKEQRKKCDVKPAGLCLIPENVYDYYAYREESDSERNFAKTEL